MKKTVSYPINLLLVVIVLFCLGNQAHSQNRSGSFSFTSDDIIVELDRNGISRVASPRDQYNANVVSLPWGRADVAYRIGPGDWLSIYNGNTDIEQVSDNKLVYTNHDDGMPLTMVRTFEKVGRGVEFTVRIENSHWVPVTIGDLAIPFQTSGPRGFSNPNQIFEQGYTKHRYIAGNSSFIYFTRASGEPPYLVVMTKPGTALEYFDGRYEYIHSGVSAVRPDVNMLPISRGLYSDVYVKPEEEVELGTWRMENTTKELAPEGEPGNYIEYGFRMEWADSYDEMRDILYKNGLFDTRVIPGMTVPQGLSARFSLHTKNAIDSIVTEYPDDTEISFLELKESDHHIYEVEFSRLGENLLTIHYNGGEKTILEFFSTEPIETLIQKRSRFITEFQQHRDSTKWYNGLYSVWDMKEKVLRGPDNTGGFDYWWGYVLASDDPALCKAPYVAAKNVFLPVDSEIESVEYYIENFVWGGLQRTDEEKPFPYGIYGTPNWKVLRDPVLRAGIRNRYMDLTTVWRSYDYPHIFMLYYHMFQIAEFYPDKVHFRNAEGYLELAYQTARAFFTYPYEILPYYETYQWGFYNELVLMPLIDDLERYGRQKEADWLRAEWEKKVKYFVYDDPYPYRSEFAFDRTAFESTYALAKYGTLNDMEPDKNLWYNKSRNIWYSHPEVDREDSREFMDRQLLAGLAVRGWLETSYYQYGSDFSLSYMARMGGWGILDYGLVFADDPWEWLQLGYASYLSSFALINTGTPETDYGYWFPGKENDGATGWAFNTSKYGRIFLQGRNHTRGSWNYDGEADLGHGAIFRMSATILANDPLFGWFAYGGSLSETAGSFSVIPKDGVRNRFWVVDDDEKVGVELTRDGFARNTPVVYSQKEGTLTLNIENHSGDSHKTILVIKSDDDWELLFDGRKIDLRPAVRQSEEVIECVLSVHRDEHEVVLRKL